MTRVEIARNKIQWIKSKIKEETDSDILNHLAAVGLKENSFIITRLPDRPEKPSLATCANCKQKKPEKHFNKYTRYYTLLDGSVSCYSYRRKICSTCRNLKIKKSGKKATQKDKFVGY